MEVDEIEVLKREMYRRVVAAGILTSDQIQLDNEPAPAVLPYCRITAAASGEYNFSSQQYMGRTVIVEFDLFCPAPGDTRTISTTAASIEAEFGKYDRSAAKREINLPNFQGASATVERYGRGADRAESGAGLYRIAVLLYVKIVLGSGSGYENSGSGN